jgi:hypothetical protein
MALVLVKFTTATPNLQFPPSQKIFTYRCWLEHVQRRLARVINKFFVGVLTHKTSKRPGDTIGLTISSYNNTPFITNASSMDYEGRINIKALYNLWRDRSEIRFEFSPEIQAFL